MNTEIAIVSSTSRESPDAMHVGPDPECSLARG